MPRTVLVIDSSARRQGSQSRLLTQHFVETWQATHPEDRVTYRDITAQPLPHIEEPLLVALLHPGQAPSPETLAGLERVEALVAEYLDADVVVLGTPMYNFGIPSTLKAYIDHIAQVGRTFTYTENGPVGLSGDKELYILSSRGGVYDESPMDHQESYLRTLFGFLGVKRITVIHAQGLNMGDETCRQAMAEARAEICRTITTPLNAVG